MKSESVNKLATTAAPSDGPELGAAPGSALNVTVTNDKKEKAQSFEATCELQISGGDHVAALHVVSWGETEQAARDEMNRTLKAMSAAIAPSDGSELRPPETRL